MIRKIDPDRDERKFTSGEMQQSGILKKAIKEQGLPDGFATKDVHVRREKLSHTIYISNAAQQMCMLNEGTLAIYYRCQKCGNEGFKNTLGHSPRCDEILW